MFKLFLFLIISVIETENRILTPYLRSREIFDEPGCYVDIIDKLLAFNETYSPRDGEACELYKCDYDGYTYITRCTISFEGDCLLVPGDKILAYPDCCDYLDCSQNRKISADRNPPPISDNSITESETVVNDITEENVNQETNMNFKNEDIPEQAEVERTETDIENGPEPSMDETTLNEDIIDDTSERRSGKSLPSETFLPTEIKNSETEFKENSVENEKNAENLTPPSQEVIQENQEYSEMINDESVKDKVENDKKTENLTPPSPQAIQENQENTELKSDETKFKENSEVNEENYEDLTPPSQEIIQANRENAESNTSETGQLYDDNEEFQAETSDTKSK